MPGRPVPQMTEVSKPYWEAARQERLVLPRCAACGAVFFPPKRRCPQCQSEDITWVAASGAGEVVSFSVVHIPPYEGYVTEFPYVLAIIGLSEGPQMMANIVDCDTDALRIGDAVEVCFEVREGGARVPQFRPARAHE